MTKLNKNLSKKDLFQKEINRLKRLVKQAEKKGITFLSSPLPEQPKRVTEKRLQEIRAIKLRDIEAKGFTVDKQTGELKPVKTVARRSSKSAVEKSAGINVSAPQTSHLNAPSEDVPETPEEQAPEEAVIIDLLRQEIISGRNPQTSAYLLGYLEDTLDEIGLENLVQRLKQAGESVIQMAQTAVNDSDSDKVIGSALACCELINGGSVGAYVRISVEECVENDLPYAFYKRKRK